MRYLLAAAAALCVAAPAEATVLWTGSTPATKDGELVWLTPGSWTVYFKGWSPVDGPLYFRTYVDQTVYACETGECANYDYDQYHLDWEYDGGTLRLTSDPAVQPLGDQWLRSDFRISGISGGDSSKTYSLVGSYAVPEPATWAMMLLGFALVGGAVRRSYRAKTKLMSAASTPLPA